MSLKLKFVAPAVLCMGLLSLPLYAEESNSDSGFGKVTLHGYVQSDILFPEEDSSIDATKDGVVRTNTYAGLQMYSKYLEAGARFEFTQYPLPGFEDDFKGWGLPNIYVTGKYKGFELTAGDFYEQFGSGFILRTYEERSLGVDNSIRGGRLKINAVRGLHLTALAGLQRRYWDWSKNSVVYGANADFSIDAYAEALRKRNISWSVGASYVLKDEKDELFYIPGSNYTLNLPNMVSAFDFRTQFRKKNVSLLLEEAFKSSDPSYDNKYIYRKGHAEMISASYSKTGVSAMIQAKRSENMAFRSQRSMNGNSAFLNNMPAFAYQHTYALAALYPYATQAADGEWAFQGLFSYTFKRHTPLGGKYGTTLRFNASYINGLCKNDDPQGVNGYLYGTDGAASSYFKIGENYYYDFNISLEKKITSQFSLNFMYMNQRYNKAVIEGESEDDAKSGAGIVKSNIFVLDGKYKFNRQYTLRAELQYLTTRDDQKDWAYGLVELSVAPYLMFTVSDMWNCGGDGTHYYMGGITGNYKSNRLMLSYGRTRAGYNCAGGVCRYVPATHGFQISYSYNF